MKQIEAGVVKKSKDLTTPIVAFLAGVGVLGFWIYVFNLSSGNERQVTATEFGEAWPLYVQSGTLKCLPPNAVIFEGDNGKTYPINGTAVAMNQKQNKGWSDLQEIWKPNPDPTLAAMEVNAPMILISEGLKLCE